SNPPFRDPLPTMGSAPDDRHGRTRMPRRRNRHRNGREPLQRLARIVLLSIWFTAGPAADQTALADSREQSAGAQDARTEKRGGRADGTERRDGARPAATESEAAGRRERSMPATAPPVAP